MGSAQAYAMTKTPDGNFMIAGEKDYEGLVIKMDPAGGIIWAKKYGNSTSESFNDIAATNDGGFVMAGKCLFGTHLAFLIVKITAGGDTVWSKAFDPGMMQKHIPCSKPVIVVISCAAPPVNYNLHPAAVWWL